VISASGAYRGCVSEAREEITVEQQRLLDEAAAHFRHADDHEQLGWAAVADAMAGGASMDVITAHVPRGPAAVLRHLGPAAPSAEQGHAGSKET
jgi:hypothetical protein